MEAKGGRVGVSDRVGVAGNGLGVATVSCECRSGVVGVEEGATAPQRVP